MTLNLNDVLRHVRIEDLYVGERISLGGEFGSLLVTAIGDTTVTFEHEIADPLYRFYTVARKDADPSFAEDEA